MMIAVNFLEVPRKAKDCLDLNEIIMHNLHQIKHQVLLSFKIQLMEIKHNYIEQINSMVVKDISKVVLNSK